MLAPALGAEFIRDQFASVTFQLCGTNSQGKPMLARLS